MGGIEVLDEGVSPDIWWCGGGEKFLLLLRGCWMEDAVLSAVARPKDQEIMASECLLISNQT